MTLEGVCRQPIVSGYVARLVTCESRNADPIKELGDVIIAQAECLHLERTAADPKQKAAAKLRLVKEATEYADLGGDAA
jgi:hypothetical protein